MDCLEDCLEDYLEDCLEDCFVDCLEDCFADCLDDSPGYYLRDCLGDRCGIILGPFWNCLEFAFR